MNGNEMFQQQQVQPMKDSHFAHEARSCKFFETTLCYWTNTGIDRKIFLHVPDSRIQLELAKEILDHNLEGTIEKKLRYIEKKRRQYFELTLRGKSEIAADLFFHLVGLFPGAKVEMDVASGNDINILRGHMSGTISRKWIDKLSPSNVLMLLTTCR